MDLFLEQTLLWIYRLISCSLGRIHDKTVSTKNEKAISCVPQAPCKQTQHCWMLHAASVWTPCCMLLPVVSLLRKVWNQSKLWSYVGTCCVRLLFCTLLGVVASVSTLLYESVPSNNILQRPFQYMFLRNSRGEVERSIKSIHFGQ